MTLELNFDPINLIDEDSTGLADAAEHNLDVPVPSCPGWSMADLVWHLFEVQHFWGQLVAGGLTDRSQVPALARPGDDRLVAGFRAHASRFVTVLQAADPSTPVWTWSPQQDAAFVIRHQVQEAAVHHWDGEHAIGRELTIDPDAATDAIEEFLTFSTGRRATGSPELGGPIALIATDTPARWTLRETPDGEISWLAGEPAAGATILRARASDLLLWLYRRVPPAEVSGDPDRLVRFEAFTETD